MSYSTLTQSHGSSCGQGVMRRITEESKLKMLQNPYCHLSSLTFSVSGDGEAAAASSPISITAASSSDITNIHSP